MSDRSLRPRTQAIGLWWLLIPLASAPLDPGVDAMWGNDAGRMVFYLIRGVGIFLAPELLPAVTRLSWPMRLVSGSVLGLGWGSFAAPFTFLIMPSERARYLHFVFQLDVLTLIEGSLFFSFVTGGWLVGAVYLTFGRFRDSPWRKDHGSRAQRTA